MGKLIHEALSEHILGAEKMVGKKKVVKVDSIVKVEEAYPAKTK